MDWVGILSAIGGIIIGLLTIYKGIRHIRCGKLCSVDLEPADAAATTAQIGVIKSLLNRFTPRRKPADPPDPPVVADVELAGPSSVPPASCRERSSQVYSSCIAM